MADHAGELGHDHADVIGALGHLKAHQFLHRQHVAQIVGHGRDIVQPVGEGEVHDVGVALADLLVATVQIADLGLQPHDVLAFQRQHHAKDAVGAGMLRPQVKQDTFGLQIGAITVSGFVHLHDATVLHRRLREQIGVPGDGVGDVVLPRDAIFGPHVLPLGMPALERLRLLFVV